MSFKCNIFLTYLPVQLTTLSYTIRYISTLGATVESLKDPENYWINHQSPPYQTCAFCRDGVLNNLQEIDNFTAISKCKVAKIGVIFIFPVTK